MRKLVLLVCMVAMPLFSAPESSAGVIPSWEAPSGKFGFYPISNEISLYKNLDDAGENRGTTVQFVLINSFRLFTNFSLEFTADYNFDYTAGLDDDHYVEIGLVKPLTGILSVNYQRVITTFEPDPINQFGVRMSF